ARMIELVTDDCVLFAQQRFEEAAVGIEAARIEDRVFGAEEAGKRVLQLLVHRLRAADEAHRRHAVAVAIEPFFCRCAQPRIVGQPEIVVGAQVDDPMAIRQHDLGYLRAADDALLLEEALRAQAIERLLHVGAVIVTHGPLRRSNRWPRAAPKPSSCGSARRRTRSEQAGDQLPCTVDLRSRASLAAASSKGFDVTMTTASSMLPYGCLMKTLPSGNSQVSVRLLKPGPVLLRNGVAQSLVCLPYLSVNCATASSSMWPTRTNILPRRSLRNSAS